MKIERLVNVAGVIGLIASLIFVGLELRQSQRIALASQIQARAQMNVDRMIASLEGNLDELRLLTPSSFEYTELTDEEKLIADTLQRWRFAMLENNFTQYQMGLFSEEYWVQTEQRIESFYNICELRDVIGEQTASFQRYLDSLPDKCVE